MRDNRSRTIFSTVLSLGLLAVLAGCDVFHGASDLGLQDVDHSLLHAIPTTLDAVVNHPFLGSSQITNNTGCPLDISLFGASLPPAGLNFAGGSGWDLSGTPRATGTFQFGIRVKTILSTKPPVFPTDPNCEDTYHLGAGAGFTDTAVITVVVHPDIQITTPAHLPPAAAGQAYGETLAASGGVPPYTWNNTSTTLPAGLGLNSSTGEVSGTTSLTGSFTFHAVVIDSYANDPTGNNKHLTAQRDFTLDVNTNLPPPTLTSVTPSSGIQNQTVHVTLTGTNFVSAATTVSVSGTLVTVQNATVVNGTTITADFIIAPTAPVLARDVRVTTSAGTAIKSQAFVVNALPASLSISKAHLGNFVQGQQNATYNVIVSNAAGAGPTSGLVTVSETLPAGLSLVSMSGVAWTCAANTCTRSNALSAGTSYPLITVTVNVGIAATSPLVNSVSVSGGGSPTANASDSTTIDLAPPTITQEPLDRSVPVTQTATFTVVATGAPPLSYQWQKNGADITGASTFIYTTPPTVVGDNGAKFHVKVSNGGGSVTSRDATLTVTGGQLIGAVELVTENSAGTGGGNQATITFPAPNFDGSSVAFTSPATDLDANVIATQSMNYYVRHTCAGVAPPCAGSTEMVSVDNNDREGNARSDGDVGISADGFVITFGSLATNLVPPPPNPFNFFSIPEIYYRDLCPTGCASPTTSMASLNSNGEIFGTGDGVSAISPDGRYIAFILVYADVQIYLRDTCRAALASCVPSTILISADNNGNPSDHPCLSAAVSAGGRYVAFDCPATNLVAGITSVVDQVYLRDTQLGTTILISQDSAGNPGASPSDTASISADGRFVSFRSTADLVPQDTNHTADVYVRDTCIGTGSLGSCTPTTIFVSVGLNGTSVTQGGIPLGHNLSSDGRYVAFNSGAVGLVPVPPTQFSGAYVRDTCGGPNFPIPGCTPKTVLVSVDSAGHSLPNIFGASISGDGHYVVFGTNDPFTPGSSTMQLVLGLTGF